MNIASAAVRDNEGLFPMTVYSGIRSDAFRNLRIRSGAGLGGLVLRSGEPVRLADYHRSDLITPDYREAVDLEGIHGIVCVPCSVPTASPPCSMRPSGRTRIPGDIAVIKLEGLAAEAGTALHHLAQKASQVELAALRQRQEIAGRLHDSIAQTLFSVGMLARRSRGGVTRSRWRTAWPRSRPWPGLPVPNCAPTLADLCRVPDGRGLDLALVAEGRAFTAASGIPVWWSHRGKPARTGTRGHGTGHHRLREGLRNAVKHADAEQVMATLRWGGQDVASSCRCNGASTPTVRPLPSPRTTIAVSPGHLAQVWA